MATDDPIARRGDPSATIVDGLRHICGTFPEVIEEQAWIGTRWKVSSKTFAHVVAVEAAWPPVYVRALDGLAPATVLTFESSGGELVALRSTGPPFFTPSWRGGVVGLVLDDGTDWGEVAELVTESYCTQAPARLAALVDRPPSD
jgi:hypothetical protein